MWRRHLLVASIVGLPSVLLAVRITTGDLVGYGWGWQMFS